MKCLNCGNEMQQGIVEGYGQGGHSCYEFTSDEEKKKKGLKGFFTKEFQEIWFGKEFNSECESFYVYRINIIADLRKTESPNPSICKNAP